MALGDLVVGESQLASPELALVDPGLAAELRLGLSPAEDTWLRPRAILVEAQAAIDEDRPAQAVFADEHELAESGTTEHLHDHEYIVDEVEQAPAQSQQTSSHYPALPAPEPEEEALDETDAALARIRERLTDDDSPPRKKKKLRRGFTIASGTCAVCALGILAVDVQYQVAPMPGWFGF